MPDFIQIGKPSSTASSMEIGSTIVYEGTDWGTDLLNQRYVQTVQAEGGVLAVEQAPNRKITLPFIFKGASPDAADQFVSALNAVCEPGNVLDVRPEGASWITRFDIEGARVMPHRDLRYHRQGLMQGTLELSTRPWGYTPTWMIAASIASTTSFRPVAGSVIGDIPAHAIWKAMFTQAAGAGGTVVTGGLIVGQHEAPSYRTIYPAGISLSAQNASGAQQTFGGPSMAYFKQAEWNATSIANAVPFTFGSAGPDIQSMASSTRVFLSIYSRFANSGNPGAFGLRLLNSNGLSLTRTAFLVKTSMAAVLPQLVDFGELSRQYLMSPDGVVAPFTGIYANPNYDTTVANNASIAMHLDAIIAIPNAGVAVMNNPIGLDGLSGDAWEPSVIVYIDTKQKRFWRTNSSASSLANDMSGSLKGAWPLLNVNPASGGPGFVIGQLARDFAHTGTPFVQPSSLIQLSILYQPRWTLFR